MKINLYGLRYTVYILGLYKVQLCKRLWKLYVSYNRKSHGQPRAEIGSDYGHVARGKSDDKTKMGQFIL
jgi:hypothetical protein